MTLDADASWLPSILKIPADQRAPLSTLDAPTSCSRPLTARCVRRAFDAGARIEVHPRGAPGFGQAPRRDCFQETVSPVLRHG